MIKKITFDTYPLILYVFVDQTDIEIIDYCQFNGLEYYEALLNFGPTETACLSYAKDYSHNQIYLRFTGNLTPGIVAHETLHAVAYIMRYIGSRFSKSSEENYAYLLQHIVDKIFE